MAPHKTMEEKCFAVTGAASGIGRATVLRLVELGAAAVAISDLDEAGLTETASLCMETDSGVYVPS